MASRHGARITGPCRTNKAADSFPQALSTPHPPLRRRTCCAKRVGRRVLPAAAVPEICVLDPDGDIVRHLRAAGHADASSGWACYHTDLYVFVTEEHEYGIMGCAVGAAFAVLVAEELFASGCRLLSA